ncbi:hypothetical protein [Desulfotomaculum copahuensis]|uniref:Uncharacterized protein n=1 Tax=Desulfotomaculum copahuensis TaxID=1838280 RepID=A0A1B7LFM7_9FIRM|nr:hypothetical protein [Desulfotomaculum copahuensis]OAT82961.1 hypothetical protein A6M21_08360 [Desulfotomaculum copahuensis]
MSDVQMNYYGDPMEMMSWRLVDRLHKLLNQQVTVYVAASGTVYTTAITGTLAVVGSDYIELHAVKDSQTRPVIIPTASIIAIAVGGPITTTTPAPGTAPGGLPPGTAITTSA